MDDGTIINEVEGAVVSEIGGKRLILYPGHNTSEIRVKGTGGGSLNLKIALSREDASMDIVTYLDVATTSEMIARIDVLDRDYTMQVDADGDGTTDYARKPDSISTSRRYVIWLPFIASNLN
jgi:hypothetical protein